MTHVLLLGAGFSRNWGGWLASEAFEYLLGCPEVAARPLLRDLLWQCQGKGGFEAALCAIQTLFIRDPKTHTEDLQLMQSAVKKMFDDMNKGYFERPNFEFSNHIERGVGPFLSRFDAIFTLNQDLLLEHFYIDRNVMLTSNKRWDGAELPGMVPVPGGGPEHQQSWAKRQWMPARANTARNPRFQPIFKLHGSVNWQHEVHGAPIMIIGGNKVQDINASPLLSAYQTEFEKTLYSGCRMMAIGYGFRDPHINDTIIRAILEAGAQLFIIAPEGGDIGRVNNPTNQAAIRVPTQLEEAIARGLIGASTRSLAETFGGDSATELRKMMRFFE